MAFRWFRKNQKIMLVVFGLAAMVAFVIFPAVLQRMDQRTNEGPEDNTREVVLTWKNGDVTRDDLQRMRYQRSVALAFMRGLAARLGMPTQMPRFMGIPNTTTTESLVQTMVLGQKADELGIEITDEAILQALDSFSNHSLSRAQYKEILLQATQNRGNEYELFNALRVELKANEVLRILFSGADSVTPLEASQYYDWLHRKVNAEVAAIRVDSFIEKAGEPDEAQIQELYEEFRLNFPNPNSPDPGFNRRDKIRLEIVQAPRATFIEAEKANVTDEEINNYYYTHLELFVQQPEDESPTETADSSSETEDSGAEDLGSNEAESASEGDAEPTGEDSAATTSPEDQASTEATDRPADSDESPSSPDETDSVSADQVEEETPAEDGANQAEPSTEDSVSDVTEVIEETATPESSGDDIDVEGIQSDETTVESVDTSRVTPIEYKPLEEVSDVIRNSLAAERAVTAMQEALIQVEGVMNRYREEYLDRKYAEQSDSEFVAPPTPDLRALAEELNLTYLETEMVDALKLQSESMIGPALVGFSDDPYSPSGTFLNLAFLPKTQVFAPMRAHLPENASFFVAWKTSEEEGTVPEVSEIRDEVIAAWKQGRAAELATEKAQEIADRINESGGSLLENVQEYPVTETGTFGWLTWYGYGNPIVTREVPNVEQPGEEFFRAVFELERNKVGVAINQPHTFVYLVRITSENETETDLRDAFFAQGLRDGIPIVAQQQAMQYVQGLYNDLEKQYDLEWQIVLQPDDYE